MRLAILCPGQGAQHAGMFELARGDAGVAALIDGWHLPPADDIFSNANAQPLIVGAGCAMWEALRAALPAPHVVIGYSVGDITALAVAGMLTPAAAIVLAGERARAMDACTDPARPQALAAVSGLSIGRLTPLMASIDPAAELHLAIENGSDQFIIGGPADMLDKASGVLEMSGARVQRLPVAIASHTPWMQAAVAPIVAALQRLRPAAPALRLLSGVDGELITDAGAAIAALGAQTVSTVRWSRCMDALAEAGVTAALELGPGAALSRMLAARHPQITSRSVADFRSLAGITKWIDGA